MAADGSVQVQGLDELKRALTDLPKAMHKRVVRNALAAGAREVRDTAKRSAPVLSQTAAMRAPYRAPGTVQSAIRVRTSKADRRNGDIGVFVNVRPAKSGKRGSKSSTDPFYWRFLEFGTRRMAARPFLQIAAKRLPDALKIFEERIGKWLKSANDTGKIPP